MPTPNPSIAQDAVSRAVLNAQQCAGRLPIPLVSCSYDITITGGLADVAVKRTYRNEEIASIEATLTFPLPVGAVLHHLEARIDGRVVTGVAQAREEARASYEDAMHRGKAAVLHEELLKGIHMLSVGQIRPGGEIEVTARFALPLAYIGGRAQLRIPTTVGDVYGSSGLLDSDDLASGGVVLAATTRVTCDSGTPAIAGATLTDGAARVLLDRPILITLDGWAPRTLSGRCADGRAVTLTIAPAPDGARAIAAAVLVDRSGSMSEHAGGGSGLSKHAAVVAGLIEAGRLLRAADTVDLWQFDDVASSVGKVGAGGWREAVHRLTGPRNGTEIGGALKTVLAAGHRDVLIVTDGKSHALDVQKLLASGARFTVVLIGEDSLEANVGHLAIGSGGQVLSGDGAGVADAVLAGIAALRAPLCERAVDESHEIVVARGGMLVTATWGQGAAESVEDSGSARAVAAYAASLRLPSLDEKRATALAVAEGLVTHLTSLVLVDEAGTASQTVPAARKVALPSPVGARMSVNAGPIMARKAVRSLMTPAPRDVAAYALLAPSCAADVQGVQRPILAATDASSLQAAWRKAAAGIDWGLAGPELATGVTRSLRPDVAAAIDRMSGHQALVAAASRAGISPRQLVIALLAHEVGTSDRNAERVARKLLGKVPDDVVRMLVPLLKGADSAHA